MKYEMISVNGNEIKLKEEFADRYKMLLACKNELTKLEQQFKEEILSAFEEHNIVSLENDFIRIKYIPETKKKIVDNDKLKEMCIFDDVLKESKVKSSVRVTVK